jgi:hypothetical protein
MATTNALKLYLQGLATGSINPVSGFTAGYKIAEAMDPNNIARRLAKRKLDIEEAGQTEKAANDKFNQGFKNRKLESVEIPNVVVAQRKVTELERHNPIAEEQKTPEYQQKVEAGKQTERRKTNLEKGLGAYGYGITNMPAEPDINTISAQPVDNPDVQRRFGAGYKGQDYSPSDMQVRMRALGAQQQKDAAESAVKVNVAKGKEQAKVGPAVQIAYGKVKPQLQVAQGKYDINHPPMGQFQPVPFSEILTRGPEIRRMIASRPPAEQAVMTKEHQRLERMTLLQKEANNVYDRYIQTFALEDNDPNRPNTTSGLHMSDIDNPYLMERRLLNKKFNALMTTLENEKGRLPVQSVQQYAYMAPGQGGTVIGPGHGGGIIGDIPFIKDIQVPMTGSRGVGGDDVATINKKRAEFNGLFNNIFSSSTLRDSIISGLPTGD